MSSPILSNNVKERVSLDEEDNPITILLLANPSAAKAASTAALKRRMRGWRWDSRDGEKWERLGDQEGMPEEPKDELRLMRFVVAERKRNLKNSVGLEILFNGTQLCVQSTGWYLFNSLQFHNQPNPLQWFLLNRETVSESKNNIPMLMTT